MTTTAAPPRCDARAVGRVSTDWGFESMPCNARRGLRSFVDHEGTTRYACAAPGHFANVERRFGHLPTVEPCFICGRLAPILDGIYTRVTVGGDVRNLCDICREKADLPEDRELVVEDHDAFVVTADLEA